MEVLVLDTEGYGSANESQSHNIKVLVLSIYLSSLLIFNSLQFIDESTLEYLGMSLDSIKQFIKDSKLTLEDFNVPKFLWVLRDFSLKLRE